MRKFAFILLGLLLLAGQALALDIPKASGYVTDQAGLLSQTVELKLEQFLREFENSDSTQIVVLTVPSLEGEALGEFSLRVFENWKIGQLGKDNGALLLVTKQERKIRIEVGYGLEGKLTDLLSGRIIDNDISPKFKQGNFDGGIIAGVTAMAEVVKGEYVGSQRTQKKKSGPSNFILFLFFALPMLSRIFTHRGHNYRSRRGGIYIGGGRGGFGGGGFGGGGGFSGGGGGGGGGGASGGW